MRSREASDRLDRHALVMAIWLPAGFVALALLHYGFNSGGPLWVLGGFVPILAGFAAHVIVNAVLGTDFTEREVGLALTLVAAAMLSLVVAVFLADGFAERFFLPVMGCTTGLLAIIVAYLLIRHGPRRALEAFDIIRDNNPRRASRLPYRGGRR
jgi:protein-S-isoprenylcysteine O-methyltransferase Ste14